jgi:hypothetical protein
MATFIGVPRAVLNAAIGDMPGWRDLGNRMLAQVQENCPVSDDDSSDEGPHLRDTMVVHFISGADARILIGSQTKGDVLGYLTKGTEDHFVAPVNATVLAWTSGGGAFFSMGHTVSGISANSFVIDSCREIVSGS